MSEFQLTVLLLISLLLPLCFLAPCIGTTCSALAGDAPLNIKRSVYRHGRYQHHSYLISFPKGIIEISISLKCCFAKGIPMMVMVSSRPKRICTSAVYNPPHKSHIILKSTERQPAPDELLTTSLPKGHSTSPASLKHCSPQGMPTTVIHKKIPPNK